MSVKALVVQEGRKTIKRKSRRCALLSSPPRTNSKLIVSCLLTYQVPARTKYPSCWIYRGYSSRESKSVAVPEEMPPTFRGGRSRLARRKRKPQSYTKIRRRMCDKQRNKLHAKGFTRTYVWYTGKPTRRTTAPSSRLSCHIL